MTAVSLEAISFFAAQTIRMELCSRQLGHAAQHISLLVRGTQFRYCRWNADAGFKLPAAVRGGRVRNLWTTRFISCSPIEFTGRCSGCLCATNRRYFLYASGINWQALGEQASSRCDKCGWKWLDIFYWLRKTLTGRNWVTFNVHFREMGERMICNCLESSRFALLKCRNGPYVDIFP